MANIELIYDKDCPNIGAARTVLLETFSSLGLAPHWIEWESSGSNLPKHAYGYGSPTILINGKDVSGVKPSDINLCCRIYDDIDGNNRGVPSIDMIASAIKDASLNSNKVITQTVRLNLSLLPSILIAALPKLVCPACWPAYTGLLSTLGVGFINYSPYLLPMTAVFLCIALAALFYRAGERRGYLPFMFGLISAFLIIFGKFKLDSDLIMYFGLSILVGASLWNSWPSRRMNKTSCPDCVT